MDDGASKAIRLNVRLAVFLLAVPLILVLAGWAVLLSVVVGVLPILSATGWDSTPEADDEAQLNRMATRLHRAQRSAWHELADRAHLIEFLRDRPARPGTPSMLPPRIAAWPDGSIDLTGTDSPDTATAAAAATAATVPTSTGGQAGSTPDSGNQTSTPPHATPVTPVTPSTPSTPSTPGTAPDPPPGIPLTPGQVADAVTALCRRWRTIAVTGGGDTGKTSLLLLMLLRAEHVRDKLDPTAPVPLRISLAGWPDEPDLTLRDWISRRVREDYPGLLGPGESLEALLDWLWADDELAADRLVLFIDGIDVVDEEYRERVLLQVLLECDGRLTAIACRTETWAELVDDEPQPGWLQLTVTAPQKKDMEAFLSQAKDLAAALIAGGKVTEPLWHNARLLQLLLEAYPDAPDRSTAHLPAWLTTDRPADTDAAMRAMWTDLTQHRVAWPGGPAEQERTLSTLRWLAGQELFEDHRFEWWKVPGRATDDDTLAAANRFLWWRRTGSAVLWAAGAFGTGLAVLVVLMLSGLVQGYDRADQGQSAAGGLTWADVHVWVWNSGALTHVLGNPAYLAVIDVLLAVAMIGALAMFGQQLEHPDGGQPQTLRLGLPTGREVPLLIRAIPRRALQGVLGAAVVGAALQISGNGAAHQLFASCAITGVILLLLAWLHWCAEAPTDPRHRTPAGMFAADRTSAWIVAMSIGAALSVAAGVLSWCFTSFGHIPTMSQCLGIITSMSVGVGVGRGLFLGAGMGTAWLLRLRPGFGLGYGARLEALEYALRRKPPSDGAPAPVRLIGLLNLHEGPSAQGGPIARNTPPLSRLRIKPKAPGTWQPALLSPQALLRPVGTQIRLRESSLEHYLQPSSTVGSGDGGGRVATRDRSSRSWLAAVVLIPTVLLAGLTVTGTASVILPRVPCSRWHSGSLLTIEALHGQPRSRVWLENGQCVGFIVPGAQGWPKASLDLPGRSSNSQETERDRIIDEIGTENAKIPAGNTHAVTVLFLAPLTRTKVGEGRAINGLWQLDGALAALHQMQNQGALVRLVVANAGENFASGPSVVQTILRSFPADGSWSIQAVIGISQSRASARESMRELNRIPVIAASVNGDRLRDGLPPDEPLKLQVSSASPGDRQVAAAMLGDKLLATVAARSPNGDTTAAGRQVGIVGAPDDPYFSAELMTDLRADLHEKSLPLGNYDDASVDAGAPQQFRRDARDRQLDIGESAPRTSGKRFDPVAITATAMCTHPNDFWLFAGRGNQLTELDHTIHRQYPKCQPLMIVGPGAISAVGVSNEPDAQLKASANLFSYSLVDRPFQPYPTVHDASRALSIERGSDRATGYTAMIEAARDEDSPTCPGPRGPLGWTPDANGHSTLGASSDPCAQPGGSAIWFCPFDGNPCISDHSAVPAPGAGTTTGTGTTTPAPTPIPTTTPVPSTTTSLPPSEPAIVQRSGNNPDEGEGLRWYQAPNGAPQHELLPWDTKVTVLCRVPGERAHDHGWVGVSVDPGADRVSGSGFVWWKRHVVDDNVYLRFPLLPGGLGSGDPTSTLLPSTLPSCSTTRALKRLVDARVLAGL